MVILHAAFSDRQWLLWGEDSNGDDAEPQPKRRGRKPKIAPAANLPFGAVVAALSGALTGIGISAETDTNIQPFLVWLPTAGGYPFASSTLIAKNPTVGPSIEIRPWQASMVALAPGTMLDLLCLCHSDNLLAPGIMAGADLLFWGTALRLAGSLVSRQQYLPGLVQEGDSIAARWQPVLGADDATRLARLSSAMPSACRAVTPTSENAPPERASLAVLESAVAAMTDALVRETLSERPTLPRSGKGEVRFATLHDQWLHRLDGADPIMSGTRGELTQFLARVRDWHRPATMGASSPFCLCFRLEEPVGEDAPWHLSYLLQDASDQSLLIPLEAAWKSRGAASRQLKRPGFQPHEFILATLGRAATISSTIAASLKGSAPDGCALEVNGAFEFLGSTAPALEQAGFIVLLPAWWSRRGPQQRLSARAVVQGGKTTGQGLSLDEILRFNWELALGDETITLKELQDLARLKSPLVRLRGQWIQVGADEIRNAIEFLKRRGGETATARDLLRLALGQGEGPGGISLAGIRAGGWFGELLAQFQGGVQFQEMPQPAGLCGSLRPYQLRGYAWLSFLQRWGLGACLADDMGLGKTIQTLSLVLSDRETGATEPFLLVCPTTVIGNWQREAARFAPGLKVTVHHGVTRAKGKSFSAGVSGQDLVLISYGLLHRDLDALAKVTWRGVVLDEAQNIKNPVTKQAQAARSLPASLRIALTGTPVENSVADLWSVMEFLNPGLLGSQAEFRRRFIIPIQSRRDPDATQRLKQLTGPFILRRLKTDRSIINDLPEKNEMKVYTPLTKEQASLYGAVTEDALAALQEAEGIQRKGMVLATLMKLKQVCNHPAQFMGDNSDLAGRSGKLARLCEMLEEVLAEGDRALVFTQFYEMGEILRRHLQETFGREVLFLHGSVSRKERDRMVERFQAEGKQAPSIFILSLKAGGTGLNLTAASHVFHFDRWWNPAVEDQATDRAFRIGQKRNVQVHKFVCIGTLEEKIDDMIERKKELAGSIVGTGEGWLTELSTNELKELFALRSETVQ